MASTPLKQVAQQALDALPEEEVAEVLDFISFLKWKREEADSAWFESEEWQRRYREAKTDLAEGRFEDFDDIESLLADLKDSSGSVV
jgi:hypothetical protein